MAWLRDEEEETTTRCVVYNQSRVQDSRVPPCCLAVLPVQRCQSGEVGKGVTFDVKRSICPNPALLWRLAEVHTATIMSARQQS